MYFRRHTAEDLYLYAVNTRELYDERKDIERRARTIFRRAGTDLAVLNGSQLGKITNGVKYRLWQHFSKSAERYRKEFPTEETSFSGEDFEECAKAHFEHLIQEYDCNGLEGI